MSFITNQPVVLPPDSFHQSLIHKRTRSDDVFSVASTALDGSVQPDGDIVVPLCKILKRDNDNPACTYGNIQNVTHSALGVTTEFAASGNTFEEEKSRLRILWNQLAAEMKNDQAQNDIQIKVEEYLEILSKIRSALINGQAQSGLISELKQIRKLVFKHHYLFELSSIFKKIDCSFFVTDLLLWENNPNAMGNKKEALKRINEAFESNSTELSLANLQLTKLPESIGLLTHLQHLDLSYNRFQEFPDSLESLTELRYLNLGSNRIEKFPPFISRLRNLYELSLSNNNLKALPSNTWKCCKPRKLFLEGNQIDRLPNSLNSLIANHIISFNC